MIKNARLLKEMRNRQGYTNKQTNRDWRNCCNIRFFILKIKLKIKFIYLVNLEDRVKYLMNIKCTVHQRKLNPNDEYNFSSN